LGQSRRSIAAVIVPFSEFVLGELIINRLTHGLDFFPIHMSDPVDPDGTTNTPPERLGTPRVQPQPLFPNGWFHHGVKLKLH
tara:strand:- start:50 stop:295 length:246 start_codon:yes stop_codon:yes gene_type:complete